MTERQERARRLRNAGLKFREIGAELGVTTPRAHQLYLTAVKHRRKAIESERRRTALEFSTTSPVGFVPIVVSVPRVALMLYAACSAIVDADL